MRAKIISLALAVGLSLTVRADFESASNAYKNRNYTAAFDEFSEMAEAGDPRAQTVLAIMYKYGESVPTDLTIAYNWYMKAAVQGYPPAQFNIGRMLIEGSGVEENREQALLWLNRAADAGYERAKENLAELKGSTLRVHDEEPVAWSQNWNLRLPNEIREEKEPDVIDSTLRVYRVQIGAMSTLASAERLWQQLYVNNEDLFANLQPIFRQGLSAERQVFRVQLGPFELKSEANSFCQAYEQHFSRGAGCLVLLTN
jgi:TPR repeat protein